MMKDIILVIFCILANAGVYLCLRLCVAQKLLIEDLQKTQKTMNERLNKVQSFQVNYPASTFWKNVGKDDYIIDEGLYDNLDYGITKAKFNKILNAYLSGRYKKSVAEVLGIYVYYFVEDSHKLGYFKASSYRKEDVINRIIYTDHIINSSSMRKRLVRCFKNEEYSLNPLVLNYKDYDFALFDDWYHTFLYYINLNTKSESDYHYGSFVEYLHGILYSIIESRFFLLLDFYNSSIEGDYIRKQLIIKTIKLFVIQVNDNICMDKEFTYSEFKYVLNILCYANHRLKDVALVCRNEYDDVTMYISQNIIKECFDIDIASDLYVLKDGFIYKNSKNLLCNSFLTNTPKKIDFAEVEKLFDDIEDDYVKLVGNVDDIDDLVLF